MMAEKSKAEKAKPGAAGRAGRDLVIVESPAKARTIGRFLGKGFDVQSSMGHIADLPKKGMSVDIENGFEPVYEVPPAKRKVLAALRKAAKPAGQVWLATDEDREGEAIAWHLARELKLAPGRVRRIVFHEITEPAIRAAMSEPRQVDRDVVDAQQARRVLDRLVGYELSPVLWKKVRPRLSAGRVQSVAVRLVVEREREIEKFEAASTFKTSGEFLASASDECRMTNGRAGRSGQQAEIPKLAARLDTDFPDEAAARAFLDKAAGARFTVAAVEKKPAKKSPRPPFTTSTLQQEASQKLGFSVRQTMALAQRLYEAGLITYMRTDSVNLSGLAISQAAKQVEQRWGKDYVRTHQFKTKSKGAQEAHEAIRPTDFGREEIEGERNEQRLYRLIWCRAIGSQMAEARVERTVATIDVSGADEKFVARGEVVLFPGFLVVCPESGGEDDRELPKLEPGQELKPVEIVSRESFARPPARYTEASLVKRLEELGIGRPSTYAPTISTIQDRGYVTKGILEGVERGYRVLLLKGGEVSVEERTEKTGADKGKLVPTDVAGLVTDFLVQYFREVIDYDFTARVEEELDEVARGEKAWKRMVEEFYRPFHEDVVKATDVPRTEVQGQRELGTDPGTGKPVSVRYGPYGPYAQIGTREDEEKPRFAGLRPGQKVETITLGEALELFKLPRKVGTTAAGDEITANIGRFGPYVKYNSKYVSIKPLDPHDITEEQARALIAEKEDRDAKREIRVFEEGVRVLAGRYGPYVTDGDKNANVPKGEDPAKLTLERCRELLAAAPKRGARRGRRQKAEPRGQKSETRTRKPAGKRKTTKARGKK